MLRKFINILAIRNSNRNDNCTKLAPNDINRLFANLFLAVVTNLHRATFHYTKYVQSMPNSLHLTEVTENEI